MLANYEVEMLTGNRGGGGNCSIRSNQEKRRKGCRTVKNGRERGLIEYLNGQALFLLQDPELIT